MTNTQRLTRIICAASIIMTATLSFAVGAKAQKVSTNTDHAIELMANKADSVLKANDLRAFRLDFSYAAAVRFKLVQRLIDLGYQVYDASTKSADIASIKIDPLLVYRYKGITKGESVRTVSGSVGMSLSHADGRVFATHVAQMNVVEPVTAKPSELDDSTWTMVSFASVENAGRREGLKRILEPTLIVTTVAVTIFLLFNVRSQ